MRKEAEAKDVPFNLGSFATAKAASILNAQKLRLQAICHHVRIHFGSSQRLLLEEAEKSLGDLGV